MAEYLLGTDNRTPLDLYRVAISAASATDNTLVAAVSGKKIRVLQMHYGPASSTAIKFKSGASTDLTGAITTATPQTLPFSPVGWYETAAGEAFVMNLGGAVQTSGSLVYILI